MEVITRFGLYKTNGRHTCNMTWSTQYKLNWKIARQGLYNTNDRDNMIWTNERRMEIIYTPPINDIWLTMYIIIVIIIIFSTSSSINISASSPPTSY